MSRPDIPPPDFEAAVKYLHDYAKHHYRFTGGDVLEAWRATKHPGAFHNWRNCWSSVLKQGQQAGWFLKVGRAPSTSRQSHTATLAMWQSKLFRPLGVAPTISPVRHLDGIREKILTGKCSMREGLLSAYTYGIEQQTAK